MPEKYYDAVTMLILTAVPLILLLLHIFLSTRKKLVWSFIAPVLWSSLGAWMIIANYEDFGFSQELFIFYCIGDIVLIAVTLLIKKIKNRYK